MWIAAALRRSSLAVISVNAAGFAVTATTGSHKITDLCGTAGFVASAAVALRHAHSLQPLPLRSAVLGIAVAAWSVRLGGYLGYRISQTGDDPRLRPYFRDKNESFFDWDRSAFPLKLAGFWGLQSAWAVIVSLPVTLAIAAAPMVGTAAAGGLGALSIAGVALFGCGFVFEAVADWQKFAFKSGRGSRRRDENGAASPPPTFCSVGLWKVSRHPNYVGEIMCWSGLTLVAAPVLLEVGVGAYAALTLAALSPVMTAVLLLGLSGVPLLEKQHDEKYGDDPAYREWKRVTPCIVPGLGQWPSSPRRDVVVQKK